MAPSSSSTTKRSVSVLQLWLLAVSLSLYFSSCLGRSDQAASSYLRNSNVSVTYTPGRVKFYDETARVWLSKGMAIKVLAKTGEAVQFANGENSTFTRNLTFHTNPDGAAVFPIPDDDTTNPGGWILVSNSEDAENGGVGGITFDKDGNVLDYKMLLTGTKKNCNGGKTQWNSWVSCEEVEDGKAWQVDPYGLREPEPITLGSEGGFWESFAHDPRQPDVSYAYISEDAINGVVRRQILTKNDTGRPWGWDDLLQEGYVEYLIINDISRTFEWTTDFTKAKINAAIHYPYNEGMEIDGNILYVITKVLYGFYKLNLDDNTWVFESVGFEGQPDQSTTVVQKDGSKLIYFTEEAPPLRGCLGQQVGIYTRDEDGKYVDLLVGEDRSPETTGIAFSPDQKHLYFSYQQDGVVFEVTREDGLSFTDEKLEYSKCGLGSKFTSMKNRVKASVNEVSYWVKGKMP